MYLCVAPQLAWVTTYGSQGWLGLNVAGGVKCAWAGVHRRSLYAIGGKEEKGAPC